MLQLGNEKDVYLIDMISLWNSEVLDNALNELFTANNVKIVALDFANDIKEIQTRTPNFKFINNTKNLYDLDVIYQAVFDLKLKTSLSKISEQLFNKKIWKVEQVSNWDKRPLRPSQIHYCALDAYILTKMFYALSEKCDELNIEIEKLRTQAIKNPEIETPPQIVSKKKVVREYSPETHRCMTCRVVANRALKNVLDSKLTPKFKTDYMLNNLHKILQYYGFESEIVKPSDSDMSGYIFLTKSIGKGLALLLTSSWLHLS